jgi:putative flippase GtrA
MPSPSFNASLSNGRFRRLVKQFSKFFIVGLINTGIDFIVLNIEMTLTGIHSASPELIVLNIISFSIALTNSYFMNTRWTFEAANPNDASHAAVKFSQFLIVSLVGLSINSLVIYGFLAMIPALFHLPPQAWANVAKVFATGASMVWNFLGYKLWVFRK